MAYGKNAQVERTAMDYDIAVIDQLSGTSETQRASNYRWLSLQGEQTKIEAMKLQTDLIRQFRKEHRNQLMTPEFAYSMLCLALGKMIWYESAQKRKGSDLSKEEFQKVQEIRIERIKAKTRKKSSPKKDIIRVRFFNLIQTLREKGLSWREVSDYLGTHHKVKYAHSYIRESFNELALERNKVGIDLSE